MTNRELGLTAAALVGASVVVYALQYALFHEAHNTLFYLLQDMAFLPLEVLLVTFIVNRLLSERERQAQQHKMNMVIGTFFNQVGTKLLDHIGESIANCGDLYDRLGVDPTWSERQIREAIAFAAAARLQVTVTPEGLEALRDLLGGSRDFMLRLLENPVLLEHEQFTDVLWAVFHLEQELAARASLRNLPKTDLAHLAADTERAYSRLIGQWLEYIIHLRRDYPYLFSFAARTNPLRPGARPEVT